MTKIIHIDSPSKERLLLMRYAAITIRALGQQNAVDHQTHLLTTFLVEILDRIMENINRSCSAWEKRDYWLKADKFRLEWEWTQASADALRMIHQQNTWDDLPYTIGKMIPRFVSISIPKKMFSEKPWEK